TKVDVSGLILVTSARNPQLAMKALGTLCSAESRQLNDPALTWMRSFSIRPKCHGTWSAMIACRFFLTSTNLPTLATDTKDGNNRRWHRSIGKGVPLALVLSRLPSYLRNYLEPLSGYRKR